LTILTGIDFDIARLGFLGQLELIGWLFVELFLDPLVLYFFLTDEVSGRKALFHKPLRAIHVI